MEAGPQRAASEDRHPPVRVPPELVDQVYDELRRVARTALASWRAGTSLAATTLVHEAWMRMARQERCGELGRDAFVAFAALSIRRILVDHYRSKHTRRRGGDGERVPLFDSVAFEAGPSVDLLALDEALEELAAIEPRQAQVVELRFFGGLTESEAAGALGVSLRTVSLDWRYARAWLSRRLRDEEQP